MRNKTFKEFLLEAPLPDDWDKSIYNDRISFNKRIQYAKQMSQKIGSGSSRVAFKIPYQGRDTVLKIAKNKQGAGQNQAEFDVLNDSFVSSIGIVIPMIDADIKSNYPTWIHTEFAQKAKPADFVKQFGGTLKDLMAYAAINFGHNKQHIHPNHSRYGDFRKINENNPAVYKFIDFVGNYSHIPADDYSRIANWGVYKGKLVIIDIGFSTEVRTQFYS